jgi:hypothetical protein
VRRCFQVRRVDVPRKADARPDPACSNIARSPQRTTCRRAGARRTGLDETSEASKCRIEPHVHAITWVLTVQVGEDGLACGPTWICPPGAMRYGADAQRISSGEPTTTIQILGNAPW